MYKKITWILILFSVIFIIGFVIIVVNHNKGNAYTNLSNLKIDKLKIGSKLNQRQFYKREDVTLKKIHVYSMVTHPDFIIIVNKHSDRVVGMTLINDEKLHTNYGWNIGDDISKVKASLGKNGDEKALHNGFKSLIFIDKTHKIKLFIIHKHNKIKKIEIHNI
ncbi:hypothetical protein MHZ36_11425 [Staphylococcus sp. ACRSN]|nr:hypothetical protein [Staphylococcus sp. ACRSN]